MFEFAKYPISKLTALMSIMIGLLAITGCQTSPKFSELTDLSTNTNAVHSESIILREGDVLKIEFPGAPNLSTSQPIRRDGNIVLQLVGEVRAVGKTPNELRGELVKLYAGQIESKEISVELMTSSFPIFVTGAVLKPGKVLSDHPMTVVEAIMECGGFDFARANLKSVTVLRRDGEHLKSFSLNLKRVMQGIDEEPFYMKPADIIYVKEKFSWF